MSLLGIKKHIVNSKGEEELLNIYTERAEACDEGMPCKQIDVSLYWYGVNRDENNSNPSLEFSDGYEPLSLHWFGIMRDENNSSPELQNVNGDIRLAGFIGLTDEITKPKASSKRVELNGKIYAERKYMGLKSLCSWLPNKYPNTCETMTEIPKGDLPDTSDTEDFSYMLSRGKKLDHLSELDTERGINFEGMFLYNEERVLLPTMNTSKGTNFTRFCDNCLSLTTIDINTSKAKTLNAFAFNCMGLIELVVDTSNAIDISRMCEECVSMTDISPISLKSFEYEDVVNHSKANNAFKGCRSLNTLSFIDVPIGLTEELLRDRMGILGSCELNPIKYRDTILRVPAKTLSIENGNIKIIEGDNRVKLLINGNKTLESCKRVNESWGIIYSDGDEIYNPIQFGCFVTPDNEIYVGNSYENIINTSVDGKYGVTDFQNGDLDLMVVSDNTSNLLQSVQILNLEAGDYILSYETDDNFCLLGLQDSGASEFIVLKDTATQRAYRFHLDGTKNKLSFIVKDGEKHLSGYKTILKKAMIVKSSVILPYIPINVKIPTTKLLFQDTVNRFDNKSIIIKGVHFKERETYHLFANSENKYLECETFEHIDTVDLLFNDKLVCLTDGLVSISTNGILKNDTFNVVGDLSGIGITLKSIHIYGLTMTKDELRLANEKIV